jgi:glyoxylase I family protein
MEVVTGIGGLFIRASDPQRLARWYEQHLGVAALVAGTPGQPWQQQAGPTVFAAFDEQSTYFGGAQQRWMLNFRVRDLGAMVAQLKAAGVAVEPDPESYPQGRFARLHDPEGNPIELWQPAAAG